MRLIDAEQFEVIAIDNKSDDFAMGAMFILEKIDKAPTIDPVHAAGACYCRECEYFRVWLKGTEREWCSCYLWTVDLDVRTDPDAFCSYGEWRVE